MAAAAVQVAAQVLVLVLVQLKSRNGNEALAMWHLEHVAYGDLTARSGQRIAGNPTQVTLNATRRDAAAALGSGKLTVIAYWYRACF
jgi:hypothetical protein